MIYDSSHPPVNPCIRKAKRVIGKTLAFRDATPADAAFILLLRTNEKKGRFLGATTPDLDAQQAWLQGYAQATDQAYFIILYQDQPIGTVRLYDARDHSFCWGSWILKDGSPSQAAMESALMVYAYAVDHLGFTAAHFDVRKGNDRVWKFHERFGAQRTGETEMDYLYTLDLDAIHASRQRYAKFLPAGVSVTDSWS